MLTIPNCVAFLAILQQRLSASRQRIDALQVGKGVADLLIGIDAQIDERTVIHSPTAHKEWSDKIADIYTRIENIEGDLATLEESLYTEFDITIPDNFKLVHTAILNGITVLNYDIDQLYLA